MTRSRSTSPALWPRQLQPAGGLNKGRRPLLWLLALLVVLGSAPTAWAQPAAGPSVPGATSGTAAPAVVADSIPPATAVAPAPAAPPTSSWTTVWAVLGGVAIGVLGAWLWTRRSSGPREVATDVLPSTPANAPEPVRKKPAENVRKAPPSEPATAASSAPAESPGKNVSFKSLREVQGTTPKPGSKSSGTGKKNKPNFNSRSPADSPVAWPAVPHRPSAMNPTTPPIPPSGDDQPLETGQTIEWAAPTSTPPAIQELIDSTAADKEVSIDPDARAESLEALETAAVAAAPVVSAGPVHYYAPAPDVPSIEHRKLSSNPLPQMPLLITLPHAAAETAQFSFSPQADQSRIIGNGVRELKEFFQFELPPTEQFTTIKNLTPGRLEKRDDAWHVVQKAEIALS
ncbi:hypothetical protein ACFP2F_05740 [Hymenobacter artigasi]|uniref:LPXTG cell wall anchor domain-containing protein n=1 Tax=Hymenobacter artigasi TaxID=2719616 RepID=A0ABX1HDV4_9BACT|nr:hypothetical protein [Hymenobacter artigasi]NKI88362.1 hypothetical protein [Hymenobacter artigasi]